MKHLLLFLGLTLTFTSYTDGHHRGRISQVSFFTDGPIEMSVTINGYLINNRPQRWVEVNNLRPGRHVVRIKAYGPRRVKYLTQVIHVRPGNRIDFQVGAVNPRASLYMVRLPDRMPYRRPAFHTAFQLPPRNRCYQYDYRENHDLNNIEGYFDDPRAIDRPQRGPRQHRGNFGG